MSENKLYIFSVLDFAYLRPFSRYFLFADMLTLFNLWRYLCNCFQENLMYSDFCSSHCSTISSMWMLWHHHLRRCHRAVLLALTCLQRVEDQFMIPIFLKTQGSSEWLYSTGFHCDFTLVCLVKQLVTA